RRPRNGHTRKVCPSTVNAATRETWRNPLGHRGFCKSAAFLVRVKALQALLPRQRLADLSKYTMSWSK
ncbi:MAG: hypothetical protein WC299_03025, partial [Kiritimatiellia bacterium]